MQIKKNSFAYRVAYRRPFEKYFGVYSPKGTTTLCQFFWRFMRSLFIVWPIQMTLFVAMHCLVFLDAEWPNKEGKILPIKGWPKLWGWRIRPGVILLLIFYGWLWVVSPTKTKETTVIGLSGIAAICLVVVLVVIALKIENKIEAQKKNRGERVAPKDGPFSLFVAFLKAKKQKICPIIEFVEGQQ